MIPQVRWAAAVLASAVVIAACGGGLADSPGQASPTQGDGFAGPSHDHPDLHAVEAARGDHPDHVRVVDHAHAHRDGAAPAPGRDVAVGAGARDRGGLAPQQASGEPGVPATPGARAGVVHVHEDGFVHTHGAGAPATWTVDYTPQGVFVPERLDIVTGDTVVFVNASDTYVWPASNIHPTHEILPSFDPRRALEPGESWSYTFNENGYWRYHNHIEASQTGLVVSSGGPETDLPPLDTTLTAITFEVPPPGAGGRQLMEDEAALEQFVAAYGPAAAAVELKAVELATGRDCHDAAHKVGHFAYERFGAAAFALAGHDCHAGALHGTIESLFRERGTSRLAQDVSVICAYDNSFLEHQCLHGVGHGLMAWTTYELPEALELCDLMPTRQNRESCYGGVHMENGVGGLSGLMGHTTEYLDPSDPHFPCNVLAEHHVPGCYFWQTSNLYWFGYETPEVVAVCDEAPASSTPSCFWSLGRDLGSIHRDDPAIAASQCSLAGAVDRIADCFRGLALSRFTEPANAGFSADVCTIADSEEDPQVADGCWEMVLRDAPDIFSDPAGMRAFCDSIAIAGRRQACRAAWR